MALTKVERGNVFRTQVIWKSGSTYTDPSSNVSNIEITAPDGTSYLSESGNRRSEGIFDYHVSTATSDDLGIYKIRHYGHFSYPKGYLVKSDAYEIQFVDLV